MEIKLACEVIGKFKVVALIYEKILYILAIYLAVITISLPLWKQVREELRIVIFGLQAKATLSKKMFLMFIFQIGLLLIYLIDTLIIFAISTQEDLPNAVHVLMWFFLGILSVLFSRRYLHFLAIRKKNRATAV